MMPLDMDLWEKYVGAPARESPVGQTLAMWKYEPHPFDSRLAEWRKRDPSGLVATLSDGMRLGRLVADCPVHYTSPNAPTPRDLVGTTFLSVLAGALALRAYHRAAL